MKAILCHCWVPGFFGQRGSHSPTFNNPISGSKEKIKDAIETWQPKYIIWIL